MSTVIFQAQKLYENEEFLGDCPAGTVGGFNCDLMQGTPRLAWLIRSDAFEQFKVTFTNPKDNNALQGVWVSIGGLGTLLNVATVAEVIAACNSCCGSTPNLAAKYATIPVFLDPVAATYTMTREEDNSEVAFGDFSRDYLKYIIPGTLLRTAYSGGRATYTFSSYRDPVPQGPDVLHSTTPDLLTGETARVFNSNTIGALGGSQQYSMNVSADGIDYPVLLNATSLASLVTAANARADLAALGTWTQASGVVTLTSSVIYGARIVMAIIAA